jgi:hypothetical protein
VRARARRTLSPGPDAPPGRMGVAASTRSPRQAAQRDASQPSEEQRARAEPAAGAPSPPLPY